MYDEVLSYGDFVDNKTYESNLFARSIRLLSI